MRMWRLANWAWGLIFVTIGVMLLVRPTNGAGAVQTWPIRLVSLAVLAGAFVIVVAIQWLWRWWLQYQSRK